MKEIRDRIAALGPGQRVIAVAGAPGSGKSTLAARLVEALENAALVPMDGFHLDDRLLEEDGVLSLHLASPQYHPERVTELLARLHSHFARVRPYLVPIALYGGIWAMACARAVAPDIVVAMSIPRFTASLLSFVPSPRELWP